MSEENSCVVFLSRLPIEGEIFIILKKSSCWIFNHRMHFPHSYQGNNFFICPSFIYFVTYRSVAKAPFFNLFIFWGEGVLLDIDKKVW